MIVGLSFSKQCSTTVHSEGTGQAAPNGEKPR
jgi:hypothetical protein